MNGRKNHWNNPLSFCEEGVGGVKKIRLPQLHDDGTELPLLLDENRTSEYLGVSLSFLRKGRSEGAPGGRTQAPPFVKIGGRVYYRVTDLDHWVAELETRRVA